MTGHFIMFNNMLKTYDDVLSIDLIKSYHYDLKSGVFEDKANGYPIGEFKNRGNIVGNIKTTLPSDVSDEMEKLISEYNLKKNIDLMTLAMFHEKYERIHPFQDGNGRTGRIILFKECLKNDIIPFIIEDTEKAEYYKALSDASNNNYESLVNLFEKGQDRYRVIINELVVPQD